MKKVVVIGGGFAGSTISRKLENSFNVVLIDCENFFEYTPGILRTLVEIEHIKKIQAKHSDYLKNAKIIWGEVDEVGENYVRLKGGKDKIRFDYLVIASGSDYNKPIKDSYVYYASRIKHLKKAFDGLQKAKDVCIIGGGLVGIELAAEICTHCNKRVKLIHSHEKLMERNNIKSSKYAEKFLKKRGVDIIFNERVKEFKKGKVITEKGNKLDCDFAFFTVGITPNFEFMKKNFSEKLEKGIKVDQHLRVIGMKNIFAAGDIVNIKEEKTAQNAEHHANIVVKNIKNLESGINLKNYESKKRLFVISLGKYNGIIEYKNFILTGFLPALAKWGIERMVMMNYR